VTIYPPGQFAGYNAQTLLGAPLALSKDSRPVIFFASTDISVEWCGYMEGGALRLCVRAERRSLWTGPPASGATRQGGGAGGEPRAERASAPACAHVGQGVVPGGG
jgi:hypothetical protein